MYSRIQCGIGCQPMSCRFIGQRPMPQWQSLPRELNRQVDRGNHAVGSGHSFPGDLERGAMVGARSWKWQTESDVHAIVKGVKLERYQSLIVVHAEHRVELP